MVVVFAEVAEDEGAGPGVEDFADEGAGYFVGEVTVAAHDSLFDGPGVGADFEHFEVVVGFEEQEVGALEVDSDGVGHVAEVGGDRHFDAFGAERKADGVGGVVGDGEAVDVDIADAKAGAGLEEFEDGLEFTPGDGGGGEAAAIDGDAKFLRDGGEAADVVGMLVGNNDGRERFGGDVDGGEALEGFFAAQAGVDEDAGAFGSDQSRIAITGGCEDGNLQGLKRSLYRIATIDIERALSLSGLPVDGRYRRPDARSFQGEL